MHKRRSYHVLIFLVILVMLLVGNVTSSAASSMQGKNINQLPETLNLIILVKASKISNDPINKFEDKPKTKLQVIQDSVKSVFEIYQFPDNVNVGLMAYGHKYIRDYNNSCLEDNVEEILPLQTFSQNINLIPFTSISGLGDAPTTIALKEAAKKFPQVSANSLNAILLIADGADSCGQNPEETVKLLVEERNVIIYTIGLSVDNDTDAELSTIAELANGKYYRTENTRTASQTATDDLSGLIINVLDELTAQVPISNPTDALTSIEKTQPSDSPTSTEPALPFSTIVPTSRPPVETADTTGNWLTGGVLLVAFLGLLVFIVFGFLYWRSHPAGTTTHVSEKNIENKIQTINGQKTEQSVIKVENVDISTVDWEIFLQDVYKVYYSIAEGNRYILLESLKEKISTIYPKDQFDELLIQARQKYPSKIWIDKDSRSQTIVKIVLS